VLLIKACIQFHILDHQQKPDFLKDGGDEFDVIATNANQVNDKQVSRKSNKKKAKDAKFGFGGKKRGLKKNSAMSSADMSSFKSFKHSMPSRKYRKGVKTKRLGKSRRKR
jgi:rRNA-processing protein EBP2